MLELSCKLYKRTRTKQVIEVKISKI